MAMEAVVAVFATLVAIGGHDLPVEGHGGCGCHTGGQFGPWRQWWLTVIAWSDSSLCFLFFYLQCIYYYLILHYYSILIISIAIQLHVRMCLAFFKLVLTTALTWGQAVVHLVRTACNQSLS